jgi:hypothetical protein
MRSVGVFPIIPVLAHAAANNLNGLAGLPSAAASPRLIPSSLNLLHLPHTYGQMPSQVESLDLTNKEGDN